MHPALPEFDFPPYRLSGTVYGTLFNHRLALAALGEAVHEPPYKAPPKAPVLYLKPRNTLAGTGSAVELPAGVPELEIGAALGIVIARHACRVAAADALQFVAGYTIVNDVSVPHASFYRPSIRHKARDGFCPIGPHVVTRDRIADSDALSIQIRIDGELVHDTSTAGMLRPLACLLADVSDFMTLAPGDILMLGVAAGAPRVRAGQRSAIHIEGIGTLDNRYVAASA